MHIKAILWFTLLASIPLLISTQEEEEETSEEENAGEDAENEETGEETGGSEEETAGGEEEDDAAEQGDSAGLSVMPSRAVLFSVLMFQASCAALATIMYL